VKRTRRLLGGSNIAIPAARLFKAGTLLYAAIQPSSPGIGETRDPKNHE
jgi:hypothetical protein